MSKQPALEICQFPGGVTLKAGSAQTLPAFAFIMFLFS